MAGLLDTGFLLAILDADDDLHEICVAALQEEPQPLLPDVVLPELAFMILRELGYPTLTNFLRSLAAGELVIVRMTSQDLEQTAVVLEKYADSRVDFVDCAIAVMAERLNLKRVLTVDRRHFELFRPKHCAAFEIAP
jgi:predicted nucleic acid-binding protein